MMLQLCSECSERKLQSVARALWCVFFFARITSGPMFGSKRCRKGVGIKYLRQVCTRILVVVRSGGDDFYQIREHQTPKYVVITMKNKVWCLGHRGGDALNDSSTVAITGQLVCKLQLFLINR
jgi:hypothetical protein